MIRQDEGYEPGHPKEYDYRECPYCDDNIPKHTSSGKRMTKSQYAKRGTCGSQHCRGRALKDPIKPNTGKTRIFKPDMGVHGLFV